MSFEFLYANYINTTTLMSVTSNASTLSQAIDRKTQTTYETIGYNNDATEATITVTFPALKYVDRIALQNINWKGFTIYYNTTTNFFALEGADTTTSQWASNSDTSLYLIFSTTAITKIGFLITATIDTNQEKHVGEMWISQQYYGLDRNPPVSGYRPQLSRKEYSHTMSDGGNVTYFIADRYETSINLKFQSTTALTNLRNLHNEYASFTFVETPTGASWDNRIWEVNWIGNFEFLRYSDNYTGNGFSGRIRLKETPK